MYIVAIGWLYVALMMAITEHTVVAGVATFVFYGLAPVALVLYIMGTPARRRRKAQAERAAQAGANAPPVAETPPEGKD
ncbi:hypothetical protein [Cupriavidus oxalaticus]|jgi:hypothetical protein|uniref:Transmembrane protein n=1 Tax=Cupriavidus oxalaticus TaxID=96344 RepID=A0A375FXN3_9BURK|nr:hypothetical protein [Cupriavidus oxalaticus]QEZ46369.1 hypothetical protein D2917_19110 [Cupriavidus oxalaticus]QRQ86164.1 hypothetical protein JTE91_23380 [Cupriavidus oxalaticus]QRQ95509.1 hypothetical protein JTE92_18880 [Cupriavidus oxalaticus]WQD84173.1 hypothetical protein U0036_06590 [Cupriavidus oxalaticus]SPC12040.1 conserved hypothetical protein [Cupriavidus oxalaticus]